MMKRYSVLAALVSALLVAIVVAPGLTRAQSAPQEVSITLTEFTITPNNFTAAVGQPVRFTVNNTGKFPHSISFTKDGKFLTVFAQPIKAGASGVADFTFPSAGTWQMYCPVSSHAEQGMTGTVLVLTAGAPGMPSTGQPDGNLVAPAGVLAAGLVAVGLFVRRRWSRRAS
jgi:plastocyanin